ncbi:MAG: hypothetical protein D6743_19645 [Calditrichaeota bacterium]|nr:MAG: hypothetical protein D6743_19645 [Calditrichota bacterium]
MSRLDAKKHKDLIILIMALGDAYLEKGLYAEAAKRYAQLVQFKITNRRIYTNYSKALIGLKRFDHKAMEVYQKAIELDPNNVEVYNMLASRFLQEGRQDAEAIQVYEMALRHETPLFDKLAAHLARLYFDQADFARCKAVAERFLAKTGYEPEVLELYMQAAWQTGCFRDASNLLKKLVDAEEGSPVLLKTLCLNYLEKKFDGELKNETRRFSHIDRQLILDYLAQTSRFETLQELSLYLDLKRFLADKAYWGGYVEADLEEEEVTVYETAGEAAQEAEHARERPRGDFRLGEEVLGKLTFYSAPGSAHPASTLTFEDFQKEGAAIFARHESTPGMAPLPEKADILVTIELANFGQLQLDYSLEQAQLIRNKLQVMFSEVAEKYEISQLWGTTNGLLMFAENILDAVSVAVDLLNKLNRHNFVNDQNEQILVAIGVHHAREPFALGGDQAVKELSTALKVGLVGEADLPEDDRPMYSKVFQKKNRLFLSGKAYREIKSANRFKVNSIGTFRVRYLKEPLSLHEVAWRNPLDDLRFGYIKRLGRFDLLAEIGDKGPIKVFKAKDSTLQRFVILKVIQSEVFNSLPPNNPQKLEFYQFARALAQMSHPNITNVYEIDEDQGLTYIAREFVEGMTVTEIFRNREAFNSDRVIQIIYQICRGLQYSHRNGFSHLNLKPNNIRLGVNHEIKIMDFRIPDVLFDDYKHYTDPEDLFYRSPEQILGQDADGRSDIFSMGVILYQMVTGRYPFEVGGRADAGEAILNTTPPPPSQLNPRVPRFCDALIQKCMAKNPDKRVQSVDQIVTLLKKTFESVLFSNFNYQIAQSRDSY